MYKKLKNIFKLLIPEELLYRHETTIRFPIYIINSGSKYQCNICGKWLRRFIHPENAGGMCPYCGSLPRNRRLWQLLSGGWLFDNAKILHFSPSRCLYRKLKKYESIDYLSVDFEGEFLADRKLDITNIDMPDKSFDLVICYHILEHIEDDLKAMSELFRILKPGGQCIIQTPFKDGDIYENPEIKLPEQRLKHFGQADHVRIYSVSGLAERLGNAGFDVRIKEFEENEKNLSGFHTRETILVAVRRAPDIFKIAQ